eukprot:1370341-Pyramimonas_sp.AAC.1
MSLPNHLRGGVHDVRVSSITVLKVLGGASSFEQIALTKLYVCLVRLRQSAGAGVPPRDPSSCSVWGNSLPTHQYSGRVDHFFGNAVAGLG